MPEPIYRSGSWRIQLRKEGISITRKNRDDCILAATIARLKWQDDEKAGLHVPKDTRTLQEIVDAYIQLKTSTLSASTIKAYNSYARNLPELYANMIPAKINWQLVVNNMIDDERSPKYIKNVWGLLSSSMRQAKIPFDTPTLPKDVPHERDWLDFNQIIQFLSLIRQTDCELPALLALHSLRRSEIFGLRPTDCDKEHIHIRGALLRKEGGGWIRSDLNKNATSRRDVPIIIPRLAELLSQIDPASEYIVTNRRDNVWKDINTICANAGLPKPGLHGLRHSFASLAYHLDWKKQTTMKIGGWGESKTLDKIYTHNADLNADVRKMKQFFLE